MSAIDKGPDFEPPDEEIDGSRHWWEGSPWKYSATRNTDLCLGEWNIMQLLLENGIDVNTRNALGNGTEPCSFLIHNSIKSLLLEHGPDTNVRNLEGMTALDWVIMNEFQSIVEALEAAAGF